MCTQQLISSNCGCYAPLFGFPSLNSNLTRPCLTATDYACGVKAYFQVDVAKCASDYCPLECDAIDYDLVVSSMIYPTNQDYNDENNWQTVKLKIFYSGLEYTLIQETPAMTLANLIANIGGSMGIIVGVSFFTMLEIGELLALILHAMLSTQKVSN